MKNFTKKYFAYRCFANIFYSLFFTFLIFLMIFENYMENDTELDTRIFGFALLGWVVIFAIMNIYTYIFYKTARYEINDKQVVVSKGVLFKKKSVIELTKIHAVNSKQSLIQRIFKVSTLMIDSGSANTPHQNEAMIIEDDNVVEELMDLLRGKKNIVKEKDTTFITDNKKNIESLYEFTSKRKMMYSILVALIISFFIVLSIGITMLIVYLVDSAVSDVNMLFIFIVGIIPCVLFCFGLSIVIVFIHYYGFKVYKQDDSLLIDYGLLVKTHNSFKMNKIKAVKIEQGLLSRLLGYVTVKLEVIGYLETSGNNNQQSIGVLIPFCKASELDSILSSILPSFVPSKQKGKGKSFASYFTWSNIILLFVLSIFIAVTSIALLSIGEEKEFFFVLICYGATYLLFNLILFLSSILDKGNQDIVIEENKLTLFYGSFVRRTTVLNRKNIVAIEDVTTSSRAKKGIYSFIIHIRTNNLTNKVKINYVDESKKKDLDELLLF